MSRTLPAGLSMALIMLVALNLRPALATISPLLDTIESATGLSHAQSGLLTTLPVLVMGLVTLAARPVQRWPGARHGIALGLLLIALACLLRAPVTAPALFIGTAVLAGLGIALVQTLMPGHLKAGFPHRSGQAMGLYTTGIMAGAALAAASAPWLAHHLDWHGALALWALPALLCIPVWLHISRVAQPPRPVTARLAADGFHRRLRAWELMLLFGMSTGAYTLMLAWLPPYYTSLGWAPERAGLMLGGLSLVEVVSGLTVSAVIGRFPDRRPPLLTLMALALAGLGALMWVPLQWPLLTCLLLGLGIGGLFPLSLILAMDHLDDPEEAGALVGFVQGGGYILASAMPLLAGLLRDRFDDLTQAWMAMGISLVLLMLLALRFSPHSHGRIHGPARSNPPGSA